MRVESSVTGYTDNLTTKALNALSSIPPTSLLLTKMKSAKQIPEMHGASQWLCSADNSTAFTFLPFSRKPTDFWYVNARRYGEISCVVKIVSGFLDYNGVTLPDMFN